MTEASSRSDSPPTQDSLHAATIVILEAFPDRFAKIEPHEEDDPSGSDFLWLRRDDGNDTCEGEVITVGPLSGGLWSVGHDEANMYGGWPTVWSCYGTLEHVRIETAAYLQKWLEIREWFMSRQG